jgi:hypothetical protein
MGVKRKILGPELQKPKNPTYLCVVVDLGQRHRQQLYIPRHDELPGHRQPDQEQLDAFLHDATGFTHSDQNNCLGN